MTYNGQSTMYPDFIEFLQNLLPGKIYKKNLMVFYIVDLFLYTVRLYVMTKTNGRCLKE